MKWRCQLVSPTLPIHSFIHSSSPYYVAVTLDPAVCEVFFSPGNSRKERQHSKPRSFGCSINKTQASFFLPFLLLFQALLLLAGHTSQGALVASEKKIKRERGRDRKKKSLCNCAGTFRNSNDERQHAGPHFPFLHGAGLGARHQTGAVLPGEPEANMDQEAVGNIVLLAIVTLISVVQNGKGRSSLRRGAKGRFCLPVAVKSGSHRSLCLCAVWPTFALFVICFLFFECIGVCMPLGFSFCWYSFHFHGGD